MVWCVSMFSFFSHSPDPALISRSGHIIYKGPSRRRQER